MSDDSSFGIGGIVGVFVGAALILAIVDPQSIPFATALFVYVLTDHVQGMIVGALIGAILGVIGEDARISVAGIPIFGILCTIGQYLLFH